MTASSFPPKRPHLRTRALFPLTVVAVLTLTVAGVQPAFAQQAPTLEIDDSSELSTTGSLDAEATGLEPGAVVFVLLCNSDAALGGPAARCALIGAGNEGYEVDEDGTLELRDVPLRPGRVGTSASCPPSFEDDQRGVVCEVVIADADQQALVSGPIRYELPEPVMLAETGPGMPPALLVLVALGLVAGGIQVLHGARQSERSRPHRLR